MEKLIHELFEKKQRLITAKEEKSKNNKQIKYINKENEQLSNEFDLILESINDLQQNILSLKKEKENTKDKIGVAIIFSIVFSIICIVTTFREFNLIAILISTTLTSIIMSGIVSIPYLKLKKDFKNISLVNLELMLENSEKEKIKNRKKYELNNLELKKLFTKNRVLDAVINKITNELPQTKQTYYEKVEPFIKSTSSYDNLNPITENIEEKVKTYSNN